MTFAFKRRIFQEVTGSDSSPAECPNGIVYNATLSADTVSLMFFCAFICSHVISFSHVLSRDGTFVPALDQALEDKYSQRMNLFEGMSSSMTCQLLRANASFHQVCASENVGWSQFHHDSAGLAGAVTLTLSSCFQELGI